MRATTRVAWPLIEQEKGRQLLSISRRMPEDGMVMEMLTSRVLKHSDNTVVSLCTRKGM